MRKLLTIFALTLTLATFIIAITPAFALNMQAMITGGGHLDANGGQPVTLTVVATIQFDGNMEQLATRQVYFILYTPQAGKTVVDQAYRDAGGWIPNQLTRTLTAQFTFVPSDYRQSWQPSRNYEVTFQATVRLSNAICILSETQTNTVTVFVQ
jgi:hypothetical protein